MNVAPLTEEELEIVWLKILAMNRPVTEDELEELLGRETAERLKLTAALYRAAAEAPRN